MVGAARTIVCQRRNESLYSSKPILHALTLLFSVLQAQCNTTYIQLPVVCAQEVACDLL